MRKFDLPLDATISLLADLLSLPPGSQYPVAEGTPERRKQKAIETLVELVLISSERQPLVFTVEDLHWSDPSTLEFLGTLMEQIPGSAVLLVMTYRPEFVPAWPIRANVSQLQVSSLTADQTAEVVSKLSDERGLPPEVVDYIARRTDGVPLFAEELTRTIVESGILQEQDGRFVLSEPLETLSIPSTLQDSLMARLDRLGGAREVAQLASVIGREFPYQLLADVAPLEEEDLQRELTALVDADLLHQRGFFPRARFTFRHALVQDAAYESLLRTAKHEWHGLVADRFIGRFPQLAESQPELLAHHFTAAERTNEAIAAWQKAGMNSQERSAYLEAISHFEHGLKLVETLEPSSERDVAEFGFLIPYGVSLLSAQGYAAPRVGPVFERAAELGRQLGGPVEQFHITWGIWAWRVVREELDLCMQLSDGAWEIVEAAADDGLRMEAHFIPQLTEFLRGNFTEAARHAEEGIALYDEDRCRAHARHTGQNVGVTMQCYHALTLWHLGYPEQAVDRVNKAVELARSLDHPFSLAYAVHHAGWLQFHCGDAEAVLKYAEEELSIAGDQKMIFWQAEGSICKGYSLLLDGRAEESQAAMQLGVDILKMSGAGLSLSQFYSLIASAHLMAGRAAEALVLIDEAVSASAQNGNAFFLSETYRILGDILLACPDANPTDVEAAYKKSLEIATSQQARLPELRTTVSLCRLWQSQGRSGEALAMLTPILEWFQEGFEFPDLIAANELKAILKTP
jgi:tetratricopeptide (TPR) repeat protein